MARKRNPGFKILRPLAKEEVTAIAVRRRTSILRSTFSIGLLIFLMAAGTYLLVAHHPYTGIRQVRFYEKTSSESSRYAVFQDGIIRYNRNGVAFLNKKNKEMWIWPSQFSNPATDINENAFAIGDIEGNIIQVFTKNGLKGEVETPLPIEKFSVSNQGIVSVIMKNEMSPQIVTYDAAGNVLVENQISPGTLGYPIGLDMSPDGLLLAVSYLKVEGNRIKTNLIYYNFGETGKEKENHQVTLAECENTIIPELFFMDADCSVAVGDESFFLYKGKNVPVLQKEVDLGQEIRSVFHTDSYIGFVLLNAEKSGFELRLYNKQGKQILSKAIGSDYSHVQMKGGEIVLYEGTRLCIVTDKGVVRFEGNVGTEPLAILQVNELNQYLMMNEGELQSMRLKY